MSIYQYPTFATLPHTDYSVTVTCEISKEDKPSTATGGLEAIIELRIRQKYALILEPVEGQRVSLESDYVVSPEFTLQFNIPLALFAANGPDILRWQDHVVSTQLTSLPIDACLGQFLKPHIQLAAASLARKIGHRREFKMIFYVMASKIDLADVAECDKIQNGWSVEFNRIVMLMNRSLNLIGLYYT